jgi:hypothetical protein
MRSPFVVLAVFPVALLGCDPPAPGGGASSAQASPSASPSAPSASPSATAEAPAAPENLDVASLQKAMKCAFDARSGPCGILTQFTSCSPWNAAVPSGDGRWIGHGYVVASGKTTQQITLVRSRRVPSNEVGPGQVPARISVAEIPKEERSAFSQADRAIRAYMRSDQPSKGNATLEYIKQKTDWPEFFATQTTGGQVYVISQAGGYLCQGAKKQLLLVQRAATRGSNSDGVYAELWATMW